MLNLKSKNTHVVFDEYGMALVKGDELSWRDSIGRTVLAWIAYGKPEELRFPLEKCLVGNTSSLKLELFRHPNHKELSSRDHWSYFVIYRFLYSDKEDFDYLIKYGVPRMRGLNLWMKALAGNKKAEWWYYFWNIPFARFGNAWNRLIKCMDNCGYERSNEWWCGYEDGTDLHNRGWHLQANLSRWQKFWLHGPRFKLFSKEYHLEIILPAYALHNKAWQIYVMPESYKKAYLQKCLLSRVGESNILMRLLMGDTTVTQQDVDNYPHMTNYRPGVYLDETCRRDIREMTQQEAQYNTYERDLIIWLWKESK